MTAHHALTLTMAALAAVLPAIAAESKAGESPAEHLPAHSRLVTWFEERADWLQDGKRLLFLSKTFGDAMELDVERKSIRNLTAHYPHHGYTRALYLADEPEGIFPDGRFTLVECDKQNRRGLGQVDLWKLKLDGSGQSERLTSFRDYPGYKASNPVVSDNGRLIAFQMAKSQETAGVGHGLLICALEPPAQPQP